MADIVDGPKPYRVAVNGPFERLPQCGCDEGVGPTWREQRDRIDELEEALRTVIAWEGVIELVQPDIGAMAAMQRARAVLERKT